MDREYFRIDERGYTGFAAHEDEGNPIYGFKPRAICTKGLIPVFVQE
jgi:hypothetical protein